MAQTQLPILQTQTLTRGDRVNWLYTPLGARCLPLAIAAVVEQVGPAFIMVRIAVRNPTTNRWHTEFRWVDPARLSLRTLPVPPVDNVLH